MNDFFRRFFHAANEARKAERVRKSIAKTPGATMLEGVTACLHGETVRRQRSRAAKVAKHRATVIEAAILRFSDRLNPLISVLIGSSTLDRQSGQESRLGPHAGTGSRTQRHQRPKRRE